MALKEQLDRFNRQQVKCQSTLSSIASSRERAVPSRQLVPLPAAITQKKPDAAPIKFSNDTERLSRINQIRRSPVGAQIKRVIDLLYDRRQALTPEEINEACFVDMRSNKAVFDSLKKNPKAHFDGEKFSYKATHDVKDKRQLLSLVSKYPDGIAVVNLKDAYPNVMEDLQALHASGDIWLLSNSQEEIAYPNDFKSEIKVDDDFKSLFRSIDIPNDMLDVEKELLKIGLKPATNTAERRAAAQKYGVNKSKDKKKKKPEISKRTKLTNAHLPELFQNLNASSSRNQSNQSSQPNSQYHGTA